MSMSPSIGVETQQAPGAGPMIDLPQSMPVHACAGGEAVPHSAADSSGIRGSDTNPKEQAAPSANHSIQILHRPIPVSLTIPVYFSGTR